MYIYTPQRVWRFGFSCVCLFGVWNTREYACMLCALNALVCVYIVCFECIGLLLSLTNAYMCTFCQFDECLHVHVLSV